VRGDCERKGILLNVVDDPELCDFILPANIRRGNLTVSIATQGKAPFYTRHFKSKLESKIPRVEGDILKLAAEYRQKVFSDSYFQEQGKKRAAFKEFNDVDWEDVIMNNGIDGAKSVMEDLLIKIKSNMPQKK
jgi:siroheme synthase-like protein